MLRKLSVFLLVMILMFTMSVTVWAEPLKAEAPFGTAVIDGKNTDGEWDNVPEYPINKFKEGTRQDENFKASFKVKFDGKHLYVFIDVKDSTVSKRPGGVDNNAQDRISTYIDYSNTGEGQYDDPFLKQYQVATNRYGDFGQYDCIPYDLNNNIEIKVVDSPTGYTTEYKLNLEGITGEKITSDKVIGFDIQVSDMDTNSRDVRLGAYGWNDGENRAWKYVSALGKLTLKVKAEENTPAPSENPTATPTGEQNTESPTDEPTETSTPDGTTSASPTKSPDVTSSATPRNKTEKEANFPWPIIVIAVVAIAAGGAALYFFVIKKKER